MKKTTIAVLLTMFAAASLTAAEPPTARARRAPSSAASRRVTEKQSVNRPVAAEAPNEKVAHPRPLPARATLAEKRAWLAEHVIQPQRDPRLVAAHTRQLEGMNARQVDALLKHYHQVLARAGNRANVTPAQREAAIRRYQQRRAGNRGNVGFAPVITWLPSGTSLNAGAIVSPDGRSVRMSLNPFFSSVPYFDTFNFNNGQTRRYYVDQSPPTSRAGNQRTPPRTPTRPTPSWYRRVRSR